jgi:hypothetical protein
LHGYRLTRAGRIYLFVLLPLGLLVTGFVFGDPTTKWICAGILTSIFVSLIKPVRKSERHNCEPMDVMLHRINDAED